MPQLNLNDQPGGERKLPQPWKVDKVHLLDTDPDVVFRGKNAFIGTHPSEWEDGAKGAAYLHNGICYFALLETDLHTKNMRAIHEYLDQSGGQTLPEPLEYDCPSGYVRVNVGLKGPHKEFVIEDTVEQEGNPHLEVAKRLVEMGVVDKARIRYSNDSEDFGRL